MCSAIQTVKFLEREGGGTIVIIISCSRSHKRAHTSSYIALTLSLNACALFRPSKTLDSTHTPNNNASSLCRCFFTVIIHAFARLYKHNLKEKKRVAALIRTSLERNSNVLILFFLQRTTNDDDDDGGGGDNIHAGIYTAVITACRVYIHTQHSSSYTLSLFSNALYRNLLFFSFLSCLQFVLGDTNEPLPPS